MGGVSVLPIMQGSLTAGETDQIARWPNSITAIQLQEISLALLDMIDFGNLC